MSTNMGFTPETKAGIMFYLFSFGSIVRFLFFSSIERGHSVELRSISNTRELDSEFPMIGFGGLGRISFLVFFHQF